VLTFITNNFKLAPHTVTQIYKARWQIEIFFKWIKQNLKIKTFLGVSRNAVLTQIWVAMCYYLLLAYIKYQTKFKNSLFYLHRIIKETLLARLTLIDLLRATPAKLNRVKHDEFQYVFF
jgi:IS4 transposase